VPVSTGSRLHSANSYLLDQFIRDSTNQRTDQYGGSIENRTRLPQEVVEAVLGVWESGRVVIRLSPTTPDAGNTPLDSTVMETYGYLIRQLNRFNLAYLHVVEGSTAGPRTLPEGIDLEALRSEFKGSYIGNNGYDLELAIARRAQRKVDAVAFGRPFIANPDPRESYYGGGAKGLTDWPTIDA